MRWAGCLGGGRPPGNPAPHSWRGDRKTAAKLVVSLASRLSPLDLEFAGAIIQFGPALCVIRQFFLEPTLKKKRESTSGCEMAALIFKEPSNIRKIPAFAKRVLTNAAYTVGCGALFL